MIWCSGDLSSAWNYATSLSIDRIRSELLQIDCLPPAIEVDSGNLRIVGRVDGVCSRLLVRLVARPGQEVAAIGAVLFEHLFKKNSQRLKSAETNSKASRWKMTSRLNNL